MSMLAERKIRQKWSLNPRGKTWSEDSNKFGQKILEKMGWSQGKGLGVREDGIVEHLKVSYKNDSKGMGYRERNDQWTEHDDNFNALLESLSGGKIEESVVKVSSLEEKSQTSKVRVHYKKFTRGKDLSRWSEKDLANVFGKRTLKGKSTKIEETTEEFVRDENDFTRNSGSMVDYFKKKLPNFARNGGTNGVLKKDEESEEEHRVGFGFSSEKKQKPDSEIKTEGGLGFQTNQKILNAEEAKKEENEQENTELKEENSENKLRKKKKKKIDNKNDEYKEERGLSNPAFDPLFCKLNVKKQVLNTIEEEINEAEEQKTCDPIEEVKKKMPKEEYTSATNDVVTVKKKTKNKLDTFEENNNSEVKKKNKDKNKICHDGLDNPNFDDNVEENAYQNNAFEVKKKEKKRKTSDGEGILERRRKSKTVVGLENPNFDNRIEDNDCQNNVYEVARRKRRKNEEASIALDNPVFDNSDSGQGGYVDSCYEVKRKKAKKNEDDCQNNKANQEGNEPTFDLILNVTSAPAIPHPESLNKSPIKRRKSVRFSDVNEERIIPNNEDIESRNELFDINSRIIEDGLKNGANLVLEKNIDEISKKIDGFQTEIENEMNEAKVGRFIGEVGNSRGENEKLPNGTRLKFKYANFGKTPAYMNKNTSKAKTSYKHLIKGDIILCFNNTNMHEIVGYGVKDRRKKYKKAV